MKFLIISIERIYIIIKVVFKLIKLIFLLIEIIGAFFNSIKLLLMLLFFH